MKKAYLFLKENILAGLAIIIPIALIVYVVKDSLSSLASFLYPLTKKIPFGGPIIKEILALILVVFVFSISLFLIGVLFKTYLGNQIKNYLEDHVLSKFPFYKTVKNISGQLVGIENSENPSVEIQVSENGLKKFGVIIETLEDGRYVVFVPLTPMMTIGDIYLAEKDKVKILKTPLRKLVNTITNYGVEAKKIYQEN